MGEKYPKALNKKYLPEEICANRFFLVVKVSRHKLDICAAAGYNLKYRQNAVKP